MRKRQSFSVSSKGSGSNNGSATCAGALNVKLQFHELNTLYGREKEIEQLMDAYREATDGTKSTTTNLILIHGASGSGKTALGRCIQTNTNAVVVEGKFDQVYKEPYSGLVQVFSALADHFAAKGATKVAEIQETFRASQDRLDYLSTDDTNYHRLSARLEKLDSKFDFEEANETKGRKAGLPTEDSNPYHPSTRLERLNDKVHVEKSTKDEKKTSETKRSKAGSNRHRLSTRLEKLNDAFELEESTKGANSAAKTRGNTTGVTRKLSRRTMLSNQQTGDSSYGSILATLVPQMKLFAPGEQVKHKVDSLRSQLKATRYGASFDDIKKSFSSFLKAVGSASQPIAIFLRGLQWADRQSLDLFESLVRDCRGEGLVFIGAYRDDEITPEFHPYVQSWHLRSNVSPIEVKNLQLSDLHKMIADVTFTSSDLSKTEELADIVYKKTNGNCFFAIQFLQMLNEEFLLTMNFSTSEFEYDITKIKGETNVADNVVDLIAGKLRTLPRSTQEVLQVASFLGSHFEIDVLAAVMDISVRSVEESLFKAEDELLIDVKRNHCKWAHDKIQQSAYGLVTDESRRMSMHLVIGRVLQSMIETTDKEWVLFVAAEQLNRASHLVEDEDDLLDLVRLNIRAAESVLEKSALYPASEYLTAAMRQLGDRSSRWTKHYDLSLEVCTKLVEIAGTLGHFAQGDDLILQILLNAQTDEDKLPAFFAQVDSFRAQGSSREAIDLGMTILRKSLDENIGIKPVRAQVSIELNRTRRILKSMSDEQILQLPLMTDKKKFAAMTMLAKVSYWAWSSGQRGLAIVICLRIIKITLDHGICGVSGYGFALYGAICAASLESEEATRYGVLGMTIFEVSETLEVDALSLYVSYSFVHHLRNPLQECLDPMLDAYKAGMAFGDLDIAHDCVGTYVAIYTIVGLPLPAIEFDARKYVEQIRSYNRWLSASQLRVYWQYIMNFMGFSDDPLVLTGQAMDQETLIHELVQTNQSTTLSLLWTLRMILAYHFRNDELGREMARLITKFGVDKGYFPASTQFGYLTLTNLASAANATSLRKRKVFIREADKHMKVLGQMVKARNVNASHMLQFCQAERAAILEQDFEKVKIMYRKAIAAASRSGILHDAAAANERAGLFMKLHGDEEGSQDYIRRSAELYHSWGAGAKTQLMLDKYSYLSKLGSKGMLSIGLLARKKYTAHIANKHKAVNISQFTGGFG